MNNKDKLLFLLTLASIAGCDSVSNRFHGPSFHCGPSAQSWSESYIKTKVSGHPSIDSMNFQAFALTGDDWQELQISEKGCIHGRHDGIHNANTLIVVGRRHTDRFYTSIAASQAMEQGYIEVMPITQTQLARISLPPPEMSRFTRIGSDLLFDIIENKDGNFPGLVRFEIQDQEGSLLSSLHFTNSRAMDVRLPLDNVADGSYRVEYKYFDLFGINEQIDGAYRLTIDRQSPVITINGDIAQTENLTLNPEEEIFITSTEKNGARFEICILEHQKFEECMFTPFRGKYTAPSQGEQYFVIRMVDSSGEISLEKDFKVRIFDQKSLDLANGLLEQAIQASRQYQSAKAVHHIEQSYAIYEALAHRPEERHLLSQKMLPKLQALGKELRLLGHISQSRPTFEVLGSNDLMMTLHNQSDHTVIEWVDLKTKKIQSYKLSAQVAKHDYADILDLFYILTQEGELYLFSPENLSKPTRIQNPGCQLFDLDLQEGHFACHDGLNRIYIKNMDGQIVHYVSGDFSEVTSIKLNLSASQLILLNHHALVTLDLKSGQAINAVETKETKFEEIFTDSMQKNLILSSGVGDLTFSIWNILNQEITHPNAIEVNPQVTANSMKDPFNFSEQGEYFALSQGSQIHMYRQDGLWIQNFSGHEGQVSHMSFAKDDLGGQLASVDESGQIFFWNDSSVPAYKLKRERRFFESVYHSSKKPNPSFFARSEHGMEEYKLSSFSSLESQHFAERTVSIHASGDHVYHLDVAGRVWQTKYPSMRSQILFESTGPAPAVGFCILENARKFAVFHENGVQIFDRLKSGISYWRDSSGYKFKKVNCGEKIIILAQEASSQGSLADTILHWNDVLANFEEIERGDSIAFFLPLNDGYLKMSRNGVPVVNRRDTPQVLLNDFYSRISFRAQGKIDYDPRSHRLAYATRDGVMIIDFNQNSQHLIKSNAEIHFLKIYQGEVFASNGNRLLLYKSRQVDLTLNQFRIEGLKIQGDTLVSYDSTMEFRFWRMHEDRLEEIVDHKLRQTQLAATNFTPGEGYFVLAATSSRFAAIDNRLTLFPLTIDKTVESIRGSFSSADINLSH